MISTEYVSELRNEYVAFFVGNLVKPQIFIIIRRNIFTPIKMQGRKKD